MSEYLDTMNLIFRHHCRGLIEVWVLFLSGCNSVTEHCLKRAFFATDWRQYLYRSV